MVPPLIKDLSTFEAKHLHDGSKETDGQSSEGATHQVKEEAKVRKGGRGDKDPVVETHRMEEPSMQHRKGKGKIQQNGSHGSPSKDMDTTTSAGDNLDAHDEVHGQGKAQGAESDNGEVPIPEENKGQQGSRSTSGPPQTTLDAFQPEGAQSKEAGHLGGSRNMENEKNKRGSFDANTQDFRQGAAQRKGTVARQK